jgi:hypothetical protein
MHITGLRRHVKAASFAAALALTVSGAAAVASVTAGSIAVGSITASHGASPSARHAAALSPRQAARARASLLRYLSENRPIADLTSDGDLKPSIPNMAAGPVDAAQAASFNWSGYVDASVPGTFTAVSASWREPVTICGPEQRLTAFWVGLDGWNDSSVEQVGTFAYCFEGQPSYYTLWDMFPTNAVIVGSTVQPGDLITASVTASGTNYLLSVTDATNPANSFSTTQTCLPAGTCSDSSVEWIAERPETNIGVAPLSWFDWNLTGASQTSGGVKGTIASGPGTTQVTMVDVTATYPLVSTSRLSWSGDGFNARWLNSY